MDSNPDKPTALNLPQPVQEKGGNQVSAEKLPESIGVGEVLPSKEKSLSAPPAPISQAAAQTQADAAARASIASVTADDASAPLGASLVADDSDLIEKEWVNKAKSIVEATKEDPYKQTNELAKVKAEYMKKRYNKTLKSE